MAVAERKRTVLSPCGHDGCAKPRLSGERFCFDHLDPDELEAANNAADDDEEATGMAKEPDSRRIDPPWECGCGRFTTDWPASKAKHQLRCDGRPVATSGRIAAAHPELGPAKKEKRAYVRRTPPAAKRPRKVARRVVRPRKPKRTGRELAIVGPTALVIPVGASARLTFLDQARAARDRLDVAISAIEAIG